MERPVVQIWIAHFIYIGLENLLAKQAATFDLCNRKFVGYTISRSIDMQLALAELGAAGRSRTNASFTPISVTNLLAPSTDEP